MPSLPSRSGSAETAVQQAQPNDSMPTRYTADIIVFNWSEACIKLLTITRKHPPYRGCVALPGGFVEQGEDPEQAALRELEEETNVKGLRLVRVGVFDKPGRDPRGHVVTTAFFSFAPSAACMAGDDAASATYRSLMQLASEEWSFDHGEIVAAALRSALLPANADALRRMLPPHCNLDTIQGLLADACAAFLSQYGDL
eukprot:TRINITY_DN41289_c0_g1_i1.p1 TRINITY_DN41289_c0_g1~~TRINITY_DN41289_c0_g1_i1.p1  ORF type:complete len:217 (+),score=30.85 TRINITY_DN41289_c0_g1_i1:56-652(+)